MCPGSCRAAITEGVTGLRHALQRGPIGPTPCSIRSDDRQFTAVRWRAGRPPARHPLDRGPDRGLPRSGLHRRPLARDGRLPCARARPAVAARGRGRRRQDRAREGARVLTRCEAHPPPVLRGPGRQHGGLRVELPAPDAGDPPARGPWRGGARERARHLRLRFPDPASTPPGTGKCRWRRAGPPDRRDRSRRRGIRGVSPGDPVRLPGDGARDRDDPSASTPAGDPHVQPDARGPRRAQAALPLPLDRLPHGAEGIRDRPGACASCAGEARARGGRVRPSTPRGGPDQGPGYRRDPRLGGRPARARGAGAQARACRRNPRRRPQVRGGHPPDPWRTGQPDADRGRRARLTAHERISHLRRHEGVDRAMTFPVHVGPSSITTNRDDRILICQPDGRITGEADGFFTRDTRFISGYDLWINGTRPILLGSGSIQSFSSRFEFTNDTLVDPDGAIERQTLGMRLDRTIADGVHEDYDLENFTPRTVRLTIEIAVVSDFADIFDVKRGQIVRRGQLNTRWFRSRGELRSTYTNHDFRRELVLAVERPGSKPQFANGRLVFDVVLPPKGTWHTCIKWYPVTQSKRRLSTLACNAVDAPMRAVGAAQLPNVSIQSPNQTVDRAWAQAVRDLEA